MIGINEVNDVRRYIEDAQRKNPRDLWTGQWIKELVRKQGWDPMLAKVHLTVMLGLILQREDRDSDDKKREALALWNELLELQKETSNWIFVPSSEPLTEDQLYHEVLSLSVLYKRAVG